MTRLGQADIAGIKNSLDQYDRELIAKTGRNLQGIACSVAHIEKDKIPGSLSSIRIGIIPVSCGEGIIDGFADAVIHIIRQIGFKGFVTVHTDVAGLAEAVDRGADIVLMADDTCFIAFNINKKCIVDNAQATGAAYAHGLSLMVGGLEKKKVLLIGCGCVGRAAAFSLIRLGSKLSIFDIVESRSVKLSHELNQMLKVEVSIEKNLQDALLRSTLIVEAAGMNHGIDADTLHADVFIAAPGLPIGLSQKAREKVGSRLLHDPLQIGVAAMAMLALADARSS
jgi:3-methylornithyl-N6-L-lysine dehydrogenase